MKLEFGKKRLCFQVINKSSYPASNDFDWMCIFPTVEKAQRWLSYLINEIGHDQKNFRIRAVLVELAEKEKEEKHAPYGWWGGPTGWSKQPRGRRTKL